ncbi:MAG: metallophosphoesterase [Bryobacteraceae bacterium]
MPFFLLLQLPAWPQAVAGSVEQRRAEVQRKLSQLDESAIRDLLQQAAAEPDAGIRRVILQRLARLDRADVREALERHAATDPDAELALFALERLRVQQLARIFEKRLALARKQNDARALETLLAEHQRWVTLARGALAPAFLQQPPPVFDAIPARPAVRVMAIGDFGVENDDQRRVALAAAEYHRGRPFDLGLTLGDNFVPDGVLGPADPRWQSGWEGLYGPLGIPFFATSGNHDWGFADSPAGEILYAERSRSWRMPALYYSFRAGPAQFFALATHAMSETQLHWLDRELARSQARWKIVYGHHPIYSYGAHGDTEALNRSLLPLLEGRAQIYLVGHEHMVQHLKPQGGLHFLVAPASGQSARPVKKGPGTLYADSFYGFVVLEIDQRQISVAFVDDQGKERYRTEIR